MTIADELGAPELQLLSDVLEGDVTAALALATAPGGWRSLDGDELRALELQESQVRAITAMQILVLRTWPSMPRHKLIDAEEVARVYTPRLAGELDEIVVAVALDGDGYLRSEVEVGKNTAGGYGLEAATVLRSMIKCGAEAFLVVLNMPTGQPRTMPDLIHFAERLDAAGEAVGILLSDVVVIGARDSGWISLRAEGIVGAEDDEEATE
ncbi:MAG: hypothetical protein HS104_11770 [Polyangiaceae bacterium]|nr:hypothetical protein [Polyangiaceae bacterium]MCL4748543.1 hypothetical protein [Myxococcales bacterium]